MLRVALSFIAIFCWGSIAQAVIFPAFNGDVDFDHRLHKSQLECKECHPEGPKHMDLNKASAHKLCIGCHKNLGMGPSVHCSDCHKSSSGTAQGSAQPVTPNAVPKAQ